MRAFVLSVGSELLRGDILDTNAQYLERELTQLGFEVIGAGQSGDELEALRQAVRKAIDAADVILTTGGLGPTQDDLTRDAIAWAFDEPMHEDDGLVREIERRFAGMNRPMVASNRRQALLIPSARAIPNPNGTAPGWYVSRDGAIVAAMPGPPSEMRPMWRDSVLPCLEKLLARNTAMSSFMTFGLGESTLEDRIADVISWHPNVIVATYAKPAGVQVHITARSDTESEAQALLADAESRVRDRLGIHIYGSGDDTLASAVGKLLESSGLSLAVMESCTGGALSDMITNVTGSSTYLHGGIVAYTAATKEHFGVPPEVLQRHGLYSHATAVAMAAAARETLKSDIGIGVTGIAGAEPLEGKPPGTCFIAVCGRGREETRELHRPGSRQGSKQFFAQCALDLLRRTLLSGEGGAG